MSQIGLKRGDLKVVGGNTHNMVSVKREQSKQWNELNEMRRV